MPSLSDEKLLGSAVAHGHIQSIKREQRGSASESFQTVLSFIKDRTHVANYVCL